MKKNKAQEAGHPKELLFKLAFATDALPTEGGVFVPLPIADVLGRTTISLSELADSSFAKTPPEFPDARQEIADALDAIEANPPEILSIFGPVDGDYYAELPIGTNGKIVDPGINRG